MLGYLEANNSDAATQNNKGGILPKVSIFGVKGSWNRWLQPEATAWEMVWIETSEESASELMFETI